MKTSTEIFHYFVNLDERGDFSADVRNTSGVTIFEIKDGESLGEGESSLFTDGFMKDKYDLDGLTEYLVGIQAIPAGSEIRRGN